jgi:hypothetical protein
MITIPALNIGQLGAEVAMLAVDLAAVPMGAEDARVEYPIEANILLRRYSIIRGLAVATHSQNVKVMGIAYEHPSCHVLSAGSAAAIRNMPGAGNMRQ